MRREITVAIFMVCSVGSISCGQDEKRNIRPGFGAIEGRVVDVGGRPIPGARVYADLVGRLNPARPSTALADDTGHFLLDAVRPGSNLVHAYKPDAGYPDTLFAFFITSDAAIPKVEVHEGDITEGVFVQLGAKGGWLAGEVIDAVSRVPLPKADMVLSREDDPNIYLSTSPNLPSGKFKILVPSGKPFRVKVSAPGYESWYYGSDGAEEHAAPVRLAPAGTKELTVRLKPIKKTPN